MSSNYQNKENPNFPYLSITHSRPVCEQHFGPPSFLPFQYFMKISKTGLHFEQEMRDV